MTIDPKAVEALERLKHDLECWGYKDYAAALTAALPLLRPATEPPAEWMTVSARDGIEAQHGLNDVFPGDQVKVRRPVQPETEQWHRHTVPGLVRIFRALPLHGDAGCDKLTDDEWATVARAAFAALSTTEPPADTLREAEVLERAINRMGWPEIHAFQDRLSQDIYEDAGGFLLRKIKRLFGIRRDTVQSYQDAARAMVALAQPSDAATRLPTDTVESLGEALFTLSDRLRSTGFLESDANHAVYEKVAQAFAALSATEPPAEALKRLAKLASEMDSFARVTAPEHVRKDKCGHWRDEIRQIAALAQPPADALREALTEARVIVEKCLRGAGGDFATWGEGHSIVGSQLLAKIDAALAQPSDAATMEWQPISTAPKDGTDILLLAHGMTIQARYCPGQWSDDTPLSPAEYDGAVWSAFDDALQFEIEEGAGPDGESLHGPVTHWRPLLCPPATIEAEEARHADRT